MTDILIKGMEMPKEGSVVIEIYPDGKWCDYKSNLHHGKVIELPPHGRLLDADEIVRLAEQQSIIHFSAMSAVRQVRTFMEANNGSDN